MRIRPDLICHRRSIVAISIALSMLFRVSHTHAQNAEAESLFNDGQKLMAERKFAEACQAFEASNRLESRAGTLTWLGACREKIQHLASAWSAYKDALNLATDPQKRQFASTRSAALEPRLSYLMVAISDRNRIPGLLLTRNGKPFDPMLWNRALPVDGGDYVIAARAAGYETWKRAIHVPATDAKLSVDVPALTKASKGTVPEAAPSPTPSTSSAPPATSTPAVTVPVSTVVQQIVNVAAPPPPSVIVVSALDHTPAPLQTSTEVAPLVFGAGAVALLGGGLGSELWAESRYAAAKSEMTSQPRRDSLYNSANTSRYIAEALAVSGLAAGVAAVLLYLRDGNRQHDPRSNAGVHVVPTSTGFSLSGQF